jgi:hypothetical protein
VPALEDSGGTTCAGVAWRALSERLGLSAELGAAA